MKIGQVLKITSPSLRIVITTITTIIIIIITTTISTIIPLTINTTLFEPSQFAVLPSTQLLKWLLRLLIILKTKTAAVIVVARNNLQRHHHHLYKTITFHHLQFFKDILLPSTGGPSESSSSRCSLDTLPSSTMCQTKSSKRQPTRVVTRFHFQRGSILGRRTCLLGC